MFSILLNLTNTELVTQLGVLDLDRCLGRKIDNVENNMYSSNISHNFFTNRLLKIAIDPYCVVGYSI
jgi:hypothetical protein